MELSGDSLSWRFTKVSDPCGYRAFTFHNPSLAAHRSLTVRANHTRRSATTTRRVSLPPGVS